MNVLETLACTAGAGVVALAYAVRVVTAHDRLLDEEVPPPRARAGAEVRALPPPVPPVPRGEAMSPEALPLAG